MASTIEIYRLGVPILVADLLGDGVTLDVEAIDAGVTRRASDGRIYNQNITGWSKRRATISGSGVGPAFSLGALLRKEVVVTSTSMTDLAGVVTEVRSPNRDVFGKVDAWSLTVEEY